MHKLSCSSRSPLKNWGLQELASERDKMDAPSPKAPVKKQRFHREPVQSGFTATLLILLAVLFVQSLVTTPAAIAVDISQFASWSEISAQVAADLDESVQEYQDGDRVSARSAAQRAYNSSYVATNFSRVVKDYEGEDTYNSQVEAFQEIISLTNETDAGEQLAELVENLKTQITTSAEVLDNTADLANPVDYEEARSAQTQAEREEFNANRTNVNEGRGDSTWSEVAAEMVAILDEAAETAINGDGRGGSDLVNTAYYSYYEAYGFEQTVMRAISGSRVSQVEHLFKESRKAMVNGGTAEEITALITELQTYITEDAAVLDGTTDEDISIFAKFFSSLFGQSFVIIVREGLEAILVVAAILAYMTKSGNRDKNKWVWLGIGAGLAGSVALALIFTYVIANAGSNRELLEGGTALVAMVMLFFTSNWMLSKSSTESWNRYIETKAGESIEKADNNLRTGGVLSLVLLSFLAVFREGAETVMFYQALLGMRAGNTTDIWLGFAVGCVILLIVFCLIRFTSLRIPIGPFFAVTSILLAIMVVLFAGGGLHELIEADLIEGHYMETWPTIDWFGIYPYVETVIFQIVMLVLVIVFGVFSMRKKRRELQNKKEKRENS